MTDSAIVTTRPPRLRDDVEELSIGNAEAAVILHGYGVSEAWGDPVVSRAWYRRGRLVALNAGYTNGRTAHWRAPAKAVYFGYDASLDRSAS